MSNNFKHLAATLWREVESCSAEPDKPLDELWSTLNELDQELDECDPTKEEMAELTATVQELRQATKRHENLLPALAEALNTLIWPYWRKRQYEHVVPLAEERVMIYRSLAATTAGQGNKLCHREALDTLGRALYLLGRNHQALTVMEEAVAMARDELAAGYAASEDLAKHLSLMCSCLTALERHEDAVAAAEEEVSLETKLRLADPESDKTRLARALGNLGGCLNAVGRHASAVGAAQEAVALYRQSAADGALDAQYDVVNALYWLGCYMEDAGRVAEAIAVCREAVALRRELPIRDGRTDALDYANALKNLALLLQRNRRVAESVPIAQEAVARYRALAVSGQLEPIDMWHGLHRVAALVREQLTDAGRYAEALADAREQVAVCRQLATTRPDLHNLGLTEALIDLAELLDATGHPIAADHARAEARSIRH